MSASVRMVVLFLICLTIHALPVPLEDTRTDPELTSNYFEGDMQLNVEQRRALMHTATKLTRNGLIQRSYRWPNKTVSYHISVEFSTAETSQIQRAMQHIELQTCVRFQRVAATPTTQPLVVIRPDSVGCSSAVGYQGRLQHITLVRGSSCLRLGSIVHELLHTLGFYHQQSAVDRDRYVRILSANVQRGKEHNFAKLPSWFVSDFGVSYDYASVMHYNAFAFTRNGQATIEALDRQSLAAPLMGQRMGLSAKDTLKINRMYACARRYRKFDGR